MRDKRFIQHRQQILTLEEMIEQEKQTLGHRPQLIPRSVTVRQVRINGVVGYRVERSYEFR